MTTLLREIKNRNVSVYSVIQAMGVNPVNNWSYYNRKITGRSYISSDLLREICKTVTDLSGKPLTIEDLNLEPQNFKIK